MVHSRSKNHNIFMLIGAVDGDVERGREGGTRQGLLPGSDHFFDVLEGALDGGGHVCGGFVICYFVEIVDFFFFDRIEIRNLNLYFL